jgi:hypothetical protein
MKFTELCLILKTSVAETHFMSRAESHLAKCINLLQKRVFLRHSRTRVFVMYCAKTCDSLCQAHVCVRSRPKCGSLYSLRRELRGIRKKNIYVLP